ncbi:MAG: alpha/beta fold hydrolase, partial [Deltaproteobacteria bacterium]|nr:alpha/beta fold hydrolase [Deltaproteobacteria bacterium]
MKKKIAIGLSLIVVLLIIAGGLFWYWMGQPLYRPGMVGSDQDLVSSLNPPALQPDQDFWRVEPDIKLYFQAKGSGQKVLVVHGGPGIPFSRPWSGLQPLTASHEFFYYHQRGSGDSTRPINKFSSSNYRKNLIALDKALGIGTQIADMERIRRIMGEEKLTIIGHSYGAFLASMYAAEFPDRVKGLVLIAPADLLVMPIKGGGLFEHVKSLLPKNLHDEYDDYLDSYFDYKGIFSKSEAELAELNSRFVKYYKTALGVIGFTLPPESSLERSAGWMVHAQYFGLGKRHDYRSA